MLATIKRAISVIVGGFLWLVVLLPILGVSAYSLYFIGRYLGAPWYIAIAFSTCFDGVALFAARKSVDYAQAGLSGSFPRIVVRTFALLAAFIQTFHSRITGELPGAWILWASLPIGAMVVYEIHIRWERRKALARAGSIYPSPLPAFGLMTWILFPFSTLNKLRDITKARREALVMAANVVVADFARAASRTRNTRETIAEPAAERSEPAQERTADPASDREAEVAAPEVLEEHRERRRTAADPHGNGRRRPKAHMRTWLKEHGHTDLGDYGRIPASLQEEYRKAHERSG
jgi:hypothetical protein